MRFSSRYHTRKRKTKSRSKRKRKSKRHTRKQKGGGDTFSRKIPKQANVANPLQWDDNSYYDLAAEEELLSQE
jgi:hypothetical protein